MQSSILHFIYEYYMLDGIPAYPSPFIPIDFMFLNWMDITDLARFRKEKHFIPRSSGLQDGLEYYSVGTGARGIILRREFWEGRQFHEEKTPVYEDVLTFREWLQEITRKGTLLIEKAQKNVNAFEFLGVEEDKVFGSVYVCIQRGHTFTQASDQYFNMPLIIEYRLDLEMMRIIEQKETVIVSDNGQESNILFRHLRLKQWNILQEPEVPWGLFDIDVTSVLKKENEVH